MPPAVRSLLCLTLACGPTTGDTDSAAATTTTTGTTSTQTPTEAATTAGTTAAAECTSDTCPDDFGFVCLELTPGDGVPDFVFASTAAVNVTLHYEPCLTAYYTGTHPEQSIDGPGGGPIFAAWQDRLCSEPVDGRVTCTVDAFGQHLPGPDPSLTVAYATPQPAQLTGGKLLWGPAPLPATAACADGLAPNVKLIALADIQGLDSTGAVVWQLQSFDNPLAVPSLSADACLQVSIAPL
jgi:hypothetical protein